MDLTPTNLETITLNEQTNYRLTNRIGKYLTCFDYTDKILTIFLTVFSGTNIFAHVKGRKQLLGLITFIFSLISCLSSGIIKKLYQEKKKRKNTTDYCI